MESSFDQMVSLIWNIADDVLRDVFLRGQYRDVILPMVVLRRLDALLEPTKEEVDKEVKEEKAAGYEILDDDGLRGITGLSYYNTSKWTLNRLKSQAGNDEQILCTNFTEYLNGYSENVRDVLQNFDYYNKVKKLADNYRLLSIIERITDPHINLTDRPATDPDGLPLPPVSNHEMGTIFEELLRRFNEENNEEAGEHFTPRDAISLLAHLIFDPVKDNLPKTISLHDPAEGSGGMLTEGRDYLISIGVKPNAIDLSGTEINPETYAICKSDLIIKGIDPKRQVKGNTITTDNFPGKYFGYTMTNPPYGKSWKEDKKKIYDDKTLLDDRFYVRLTNFAGEEEEIDATPRTSDGQLLFMLDEVKKMNPLSSQPQGSRVASVHNGSSLFTGDAGSGESNTRRYVVENDMVDVIVQLPNNIFYNTGITTYVWVLTNKKADNRRGKIQLIDASQAFEKLRKNLGQRNCTITPEYREMIVKVYMDFVEREADEKIPISSKIFDNDDFRYYSVTIERPLRLRSQFTSLKVDSLLYDSKNEELSKWLYETYKEEVFNGLDSKAKEIRSYLKDNDITLTDKKFNTLVDKVKWQERRELVNIARKLMNAIGTDIYMDYNVFINKVNSKGKKIDKGIKLATLKTIARAMSETDPTAKPVVAKEVKANSKDFVELTTTFGIPSDHLADYGLHLTDKGTYIIYESDSDLRDTEKIPVKEDIYDYFLREVRPYVDDAWINLPPTKIGCEISFNKYFYKPQPLRTLDENEHDIIELDKESKGFIKSLFEE